MSLNNPLANALSNIWNAEKVGKSKCLVKPSSKVIRSVLGILQEHNYIKGYKEIETSRGKIIEVELLGRINKCSAVSPRYPVKIKSYEKFEKRYLIARSMGILIVSTPTGIITHVEAKEKKSGGRLIAYCY